MNTIFYLAENGIAGLDDFVGNILRSINLYCDCWKNEILHWLKRERDTESPYINIEQFALHLKLTAGL